MTRAPVIKRKRQGDGGTRDGVSYITISNHVKGKGMMVRGAHVCCRVE